jgi:iron complex transport system substrate-binding protein
MVAHKKSLIALLAALFVVLRVLVVLHVLVGSGFIRTDVRLKADTTNSQNSPPQRIVSIIPATTEMLFAIGAGPRVIGVGNFDRYPPEVLTRTKVGGLIDPDVERIISLKPDLVVVYGTQTDLRTQLDRAGIPVFLYEHAGLPDITQTIRDLGARVGNVQESTELASRIEAAIADVRKHVARRQRPRTLLVFGRDAETLRGIYASGAVGFLNDMLEAAGGANVFADVKRQSIQTTAELAIARAPEVIIEIGADTASSKGRNMRAWDALGSVPAVRNRRIYLLTGDGMMNPGPRIAESVRRVAEVLHPQAFK